MTSTTNISSTIVSGPNSEGVVIQGYLKKLKTMKRKYFVLYEECGKFKARLEYFDNEKKFKSKSNPKRIIMMNNCFNINRRLDTKHEFVITLSISDGGFGIVIDTEEEMNVWLKALLKVQSSGPPKPYYEHVWQVVVQRKGLAEKKGIIGSYHVCLSSKSLTLIRIGSERTNMGELRVGDIEFYLTSIRRCGDSKCFFYMEVGRHSVIGAGELWMETKDSRIAQNMHTMILNVMSSNAEDPYGPMRKRSSSATESSKPVAILQRRQTHSGSKTLNSSPLSDTNRDRCDSLPSSRNRATSESSHSLGNAAMPPSRTTSSLNTVSNPVSNRQSHSPPMIGNTLSPSVGCSESDGSTLSIDEPDGMKHSLTPDENIGFVSSFYNSRSPGDVIPEENFDEFLYTDNKKPGSFENPSIFDKLNIHTATPDSKLSFSCSSNNNIEYSESQYMDMGGSISPCETALGESPLAGLEYPYKNCNESSGGNSRASSLADEVVDGYVHMSSPPNSDYVDMEQSLKSRRQAYSNLSAPSARGMSFAEYPVEKVNCKHFSDEDELQSLNEARPPRAYSVGSRVEHNNKKLRIEVMANIDQNNCRVRAFSVGSRSKVPRCDLQRSILLSNANSCNSNGASISNSKSSIASIEPTSENSGRGRKSSSAPLLIQKSQNSVDRMDDLMEIDFSKNSSSRSNSLSSQSPAASSAYLPKASTFRSSISNNSKAQNAAVATNKSNDSFAELKQQPKTENGYLEMRPVIHWHESDEPVSRTSESSNNSLPEKLETRQPNLDPTHKKQKSDEWTKVETPEGYLEMSWNGNKDSSNRAAVEQPSSAKTRSASSVTDTKKYGGVTKMPSIVSSQALANRSIHPNSKQTTHSQSNQKNTSTALSKSDSSQRKRFFEHVNSSFTISEEKTSSIDQDSVTEKFNDLFIQQSSQQTNDLSNLDNKSSFAADSVSSDYVNFTPVPAQQQMSSPKKPNNENESIGKEKKRLSDLQQNQSKEKRSSFDNKPESKGFKLISSSSEDSPTDNGNKPARKSYSPTCTPTSPFSSSSRSHRFNNANRQAKNTNTNAGYELLHICSDSSLQTKKNASRPSSVNSDRIFPLENAQSRPNSVNSDYLQSNSVSSSIATLCLTSPKTCDNRSQELILKTVPMNNNMYTDDNKPPDNSSPISKLGEQCQSISLNPQLELHYASLDLPVSSTKNSNTTIHGSLNNPTRSSLSDDTATSLSPSSATTQQSAFTYAKIGFIQCENKKLKCITQPNL